MRTFVLGINLVLFTVFYLAWYSKKKQAAQLEDWLVKQSKDEQMDNMIMILRHHGIWSKQSLLSTWIGDFDRQVLKFEDFNEMFRDIKASLREDMKLAMWLKDKGVPEFLALEELESQTNIQDMGYWYPGEIFNFINSIEGLTSDERFKLRTNVHKFKAAVREFVSGQSSPILNKRNEYDKKLSQPPTLQTILDPDLIFYFLKREPIQVVYMFAYAIAGHIITSLGVPSKNPGTSNPFWALVLFWIFPHLGKFCVYMILLYRVPIDPVKTVAYAGVFHLWIFTTENLQLQDILFGYPIFVLLSVAPTIAFFFFFRVLKYQPMVIRDSESDNLDATVSGLGCVDKWFQKFAATKYVGPIHRFILALHIEKFEWSDITRLRTEDVDTSWDILKQVMVPAMENKRLNTLWIMNNRLFDDAAAKELASYLKENKVLETLRIVYDYNYRIWEYGYHFLLWDNIPVTLTSKGILSIVEAIKSNKESQIKLLDFYGIQLDDDCVKICRELFEKREIGVMGSKPGQIVRSVFDRFFQFRIIKLMFGIAVLAYVSYMVPIIVMGASE